MAPPESNDADSGHETDTNLAAPLFVATAAGVAAGAVVGAGVVATTMAAEPPPKKKAAKKVAIQPVSDFDDYKSMRPKMLPDPDFHSSPPPARYSDPPPAPIFKEQQAPTAGRRAMARKIKMQEGMDF
nr:hypothetical protein BaRGS_024090 [Batillaria attramentaria]